MKINILDITVDSHTISPALTIGLDIQCPRNIEAPISISGTLSTSDGKVVSFLNEYNLNTDSYFELDALTEAERKRILKEKDIRQYYVQLTAVLSQKAIEYIEIQREKDSTKSVKFMLNFIVKYLEIQVKPVNVIEGTLIRVQIKRDQQRFEIKQSDWVIKYSPNIGIGNFLLLELQIPDDKKVSKFWKDLYAALCHNLKDIEKCLRSGDWEKAMFFARKFYENVKIGDGKPGHKQFKEEFDKLLTKDQHSEEGIQNLHDGIWKLFEFFSKYVHGKDTKGYPRPLPVSTKEDAYFAYSLALGLLNLIGKKTNED
jgi:hypothetical protein